MNTRLEVFREQLRVAPARPGCYIFRDADGETLYVGKALDLPTTPRAELWLLRSGKRLTVETP